MYGSFWAFGHSRKRVHVLPPVQVGRALPRAHSITCFTGFNSRIKSPKKKTKACVLEGMRSLNDPRRGSLPTVLLHLDQVQTGHPSPSAHQFRLPFNGLSPSELRRIFCSDEGDARDGEAYEGDARDGEACPCPAPGPRDTLQRSQARSQGSVAGTVGRVQPFKDAIAQRSRPSWRQRLRADTVETKRAAHPFSAIRVRPLNDPRQCSPWTVRPLHA
jgi:hypothetical protein